MTSDSSALSPQVGYNVASLHCGLRRKRTIIHTYALPSLNLNSIAFKMFFPDGNARVRFQPRARIISKLLPSTIRCPKL